MSEPMFERRRFLVAAVAFAGLGLSGVRAGKAWAQTAGGQIDSTAPAVRAARLLYPHDAIGDDVYAEVLDAALAATASDGSLAAALDAAQAALDGQQPTPFVERDEAAQIASLEAIRNEPFFAALQGAVRSRLYNHEAVWALIGYEGPSFARGGYLNRGAGVIDWLPEGN